MGWDDLLEGNNNGATKKVNVGVYFVDVLFYYLKILGARP